MYVEKIKRKPIHFRIKFFLMIFFTQPSKPINLTCIKIYKNMYNQNLHRIQNYYIQHVQKFERICAVRIYTSFEIIIFISLKHF